MAEKRASDKSKPKLTADQLAVLFGPVGVPKVSASSKPKAPTAPKAKQAAPTPKSQAKTEAKSKPDPAPKPEQPKPAAPEAETKVKLPDPVEWSRRMAEIAEQTQKVLGELAKRQENASSAMLPSSVYGAFADLTTRLMADPVKLMQAQTELGQKYFELWQQSWLKFLGADMPASKVSDKRFKDPAWQENPVFDYIKQSYLLTSHWLQEQVSQVEGINPDERKKLDFYTRQFVDALSPSNFALTNPQVLRATFESGGENLLKGLENLIADLESGRISMTDEKAFEVGKNLAITPGSVVFENEVFQLIQYKPTTPNVARRPLLIAPPWINKFYILDLKPENSFLKWAVDQGLTVFCISWVNPSAKLAKLDFEGYMNKGMIAAIKEVQKLTGEDELNIIGYCLGGTLLSATLAYLHAKEPKLARNITSATYFTTMVDFAEPGDLGVFIDEEQIENLEDEMNQKGYLDASQMATTFNMLRSNDLIWSFVVNNYLLGKEPFPFDLLYWNSDSTRMPAAMHSYYLREMYQKNRLCKPGALKLNSAAIDLRKITTPTFILSTREDHIAPWTSTYAATQLYKGDTTFVLAGSGHIAGVINPPASNKYAHWMNEKLPASPDAWLQGAKETPGSWWPTWRKWLGAFDGGEVPAREAAKIIEPAPGRYVKVRAV